MKAIELNPNFSLQLIELLGQELKQAENQARDLAYKSVAERLVELLLSMKDKYGKIQPDGAVLLDILLSREEMASMLGTTVETTVRTLSRFKENQLIEHKQRKMVLKDIQKLTEYLPSTN
jgi:CRP/FNR family transcriptional regulator